MKKHKPSGFARFLTGLTWLAVLALWACAASAFISPERLSVLSLVGLAFPVFLVGVVACLLLCLLWARRYVWIPIVGLIFCWGAIRHYLPVNFPSPPPKGCIKIMTYNSMDFGYDARDENGRNKVALYMAQSKSDIICFQEGGFYATRFRNEFTSMLQAHTPHHDTFALAINNHLGCYSRFPIVNREDVFVEGGNGAAAFWMQLPDGDTLIVVNCHLQSIQLKESEIKFYRTYLPNASESDTVRAGRVLRKVAQAAVIRAKQAEIVEAYIVAHQSHYSVIVCGDFNDSPISYTHRTIRRNLTDAYAETATGVGTSYNHNRFFQFRIDHIFCSKDWTPYSCRVDSEFDVSDHYPMTCLLKRNVKKSRQLRTH